MKRIFIFCLMLSALAVGAPAQTTTTIHNARLSMQCSERWRPRAEQCLGLVALAPEVYRRLAAVPCEGDGVIDDGVVGQAEFTRAHYRALRDLFGGVAMLSTDPSLVVALSRLQVRSIGLLVPQLPTPDGSTTDSLATNLKFVIRPLAVRVRALNAQIRDDDRITPSLLTPYQDGDVIDDNRPELGAPRIRVGDVRLMWQVLSGMRQGTSTGCDDGIDAACSAPLRAE